MMRALRILQFALLCLLATFPLLAAEVTPLPGVGRIGVRLRDLNLPATLPKELTSGLTNRILVRLQLNASAKPVAQTAVEMAVKYDLWDETFRLTIMVDRRLVRDETLPSLDRVLVFLHDAQLPALFATDGLAHDASLILEADVLLNPIEQERMDKIRKWVAENSTHAPADPTVPDAGAPVGAAMSNALFNRIFEQYASGSSVAVVWHQSVTSRPFTLDALTHDGH